MKQKRYLLYTLLLAALILAVLIAIDNSSLKSSMLSTILQKAAIYALLAVSMNLLNGFTGLFSLGQADLCLHIATSSLSRLRREAQFISILAGTGAVLSNSS